MSLTSISSSTPFATAPSAELTPAPPTPPKPKEPSELYKFVFTTGFNWAGNVPLLPFIAAQGSAISQEKVAGRPHASHSLRHIYSGTATGGSPGLARFFDALGPESTRIFVRAVVKTGAMAYMFPAIDKVVPKDYAPEAKSTAYALFEGLFVGPFDVLRTRTAVFGSGQASGMTAPSKHSVRDVARAAIDGYQRGLVGFTVNVPRQIVVFNTWFRTRESAVARAESMGFPTSSPLNALMAGAESGLYVTGTAGLFDTALRIGQLLKPEQMDTAGIPRPRLAAQVFSDLGHQGFNPKAWAESSTQLGVVRYMASNVGQTVIATLLKAPGIVGLVVLTELVQAGHVTRASNYVHNALTK